MEGAKRNLNEDEKKILKKQITGDRGPRLYHEGSQNYNPNQRLMDNGRPITPITSWR